MYLLEEAVNQSFIEKNTWFIPTIIIVSIIAVALIAFFLIYKFVLFPNKIKKDISDLERKYEYLAALLTGPDQQYVKRLERISRINLLYGEKHSEFNLKLREIKSKSYAASLENINELKDLLVERKYRQAYELLPEVRNIVSDFEEKANNLNEELTAVIKPEEEAKMNILESKEKFRNAKTKFNELGDEVRILNDSFTKVFSKLEEAFAEYEAAIEAAHYEDTDELLPKISNAVIQLEKTLEVAPNLCLSLTVVIPDKLKNLKRTYNNLTDEGYTLSHLMISSFAESVDNELKVLQSQLKVFQLSGMQEKINSILNQINDYFVAFDKEKEAKIKFEEEKDSVYQTINELEKRFTRIRNQIPEVRLIYKVNEEYISKIDVIQEDVNKASNIKRTLDVYLHSLASQPFTRVVDKMSELSEISKEIEAKLDSYHQYIESLKNDVQDAYDLLFVLYRRTKKAQKCIRDVALPAFTNKYLSKINDILKTIDKVYDELKIRPINVEYINELAEFLHTSDEDVLDKIELDFNQKENADIAILITNRHRGHLANVDSLLEQADEFYFNADFENAYLKACDAERIIEDNNSAQEKK